MKSIIKIEKPQFLAGTESAREDWAKITGRAMRLREPTFRHTETGEYYTNIVGGIAYMMGLSPGVIIIMGVQTEPKLRFSVLEAYESQDLFSLLPKILELRVKYGFGEDSRLLPWFYGDERRFSSIVMKISEALERRLGPDYGLYIKDTVDLRLPHAFSLYLRQIYGVLSKGTLVFPVANLVQSHLQGFSKLDADRGLPQDHPAVGLLGGMVHSLLIEQPWLEATEGEETVFNLAV